jgi:hypothetical protein
VLFLQLFVEVSRAQIKVVLLVQPQHPFTSLDGNPPFAPLSLLAIRQPVVAVLFQPFPLAPHRPVTHPDDLRRLPPSHLARHGFH